MPNSFIAVATTLSEEDEVDGCDVDFTAKQDALDDVDLPHAMGGVAAGGVDELDGCAFEIDDSEATLDEDLPGVDEHFEAVAPVERGRL